MEAIQIEAYGNTTEVVKVVDRPGIGAPYTGLRDAILVHATMAEGLRGLFAEVPASPTA